jgi:hypothetical protein
MRPVAVLFLFLIAVFSGGSAHAVSGEKPYRIPVLFEWQKTKLEVLILPPGHGQIVNGKGILGGGRAAELSPYQNSYLRAVKRSIRGWDRALRRFGSDSLNRRLVTNVYVVGRSRTPRSALSRPEIVIASDESKGPILGFALKARGAPCLVDNSKFFVQSFTHNDMYNINGQEYGHCLGINHAKGGPKGGRVIQHDVMFTPYEHFPGRRGTHRHCVSNLDVKGLELVFDRSNRPDTATLDPDRYRRISC